MTAHHQHLIAKTAESMDSFSPTIGPPAGRPTPEEDPDPMRSNRRKACDLCFTKKIKCDMLKPDCSNCLLYHARCRTTIIRRKANPPKAKPAQSQSQAPTGDTTALEDRLASIEDQLQKVLQEARAGRDAAPSTSRLSHDFSSNTSGSASTSQNQAESEPCPEADSQTRAFSPNVEPCIFPGPESSELRLPTLQTILPIAEHYFAHFNPVVPLFNQSAFMRMLDGWNSRPNVHTNDRAIWAAIQIVIALGLRTPRPGAIDSGFGQSSMAHRCLMNAQSVVSDLVTRSEDLLGIQVLLGIVMLFQESKDPTPASVIIGSAVRLAHRLHLQSRDAQHHFTPAESEQRSHVFWITYSLEKDICLRVKTPSVQFDADIDLPLPPRISPDGSGMIWTQDGLSHVNYQRTRLELAHIQGRVYDLLYSNRSMKVTGPERQQRVTRLQNMLDKWYARIPSAFHLENVASTVGMGEVVHMTKMYYAYLLAEVMTHGIYSHDADWLKRISAVSRIAIRDMAVNENRNRAAKCQLDQHAPLPEGWVKCVDVSRGCMKLFQHCTPTESLIWQCSCAHFSALIVVLSNMLLYPNHTNVSVDQHHSAKGVQLLDDMLDVVQDAQFDALRLIVRELYDKANTAVVAVQNPGDFDAEDVFQQFSANMDFFPTGALDFLPFDPEVAALDLMDDGVVGPFDGFENEGLPPPDYGQVMELPNLPSFLM